MARNRQKYAKALLYKVWIGIIAAMLALPQASSASALSRNWTAYGKSGAVSGSLLGAFDTPSGVAVDSAGNLYVADAGNHRIQKRDATTGMWSVLNTYAGGPGNALGEFNGPRAVAIDSSGNVYVADTENNRIQMLDVAAGTSGTWVAIGDSTQFKKPKGIAVGEAGNVYVADTDNNRVRKLDKITQMWTDYTDFRFPRGVAVDGSGNVYVADSANYRIQKLDVTPGASGNWETLTQGGGKNPGQVSSPSSLAIDRDGNLYVADTRNHRVQKRDAATGVWSDWKKSDGLSGNGLGEFTDPFGIAVDGHGDLYVADTGNHRIQKLDANTGSWNEWGQTGIVEGHGLGEFSAPVAVAIDSRDNLYVSDYGNNRVQKLDATSGLWSEWGGGDGQAGSALGEFENPSGIAVGGDDSVYVADRDNHRIQVRDANGWSELGQRGSQPGQFEFPSDVAVDREGNLYVADINNFRIQKRAVDTGLWEVLGNGRGTAVGQFEYASSVAVDSVGNVYVADTDNGRIQKLVASTGQWEEIGSGTGSGLGQFYEPYDVTVDREDNIYIADLANNRIQMLDSSTGAWREWGKSGNQAGNVPGEFSSPTGVAIDGNGDIFVADFGNHRIQKWEFAKPDAPAGVVASSGNGEADVSFIAPEYDGGAPINGYTVTAYPGGLTASGPSSPIKVTGLTNGTKYTFTVVAVNTKGESIASSASNAVTPMTVPDAPTNIQATAGNGEATVSFAVPASNGGGAIAGYTVTAYPGGATASGPGSPIKVTGLTNGTVYTFRVVAVNDVGTGESSAESNAVTPQARSAGGGGGGGSPSPETITIDVQDGAGDKNGTVSRATIRRTTDAGGRKKDELTLTAEQAAQAIEQLKKAGSHTARIVVPDAKDEVAELLAKLPKAAAAALADGKVDLELVTNGVRILIPYNSLQGSSEDVYFRLVPVKAEAGRKAIEQQAAAEQIVSDKLIKTSLVVKGRPMEIETNLSSRPVTLTLPLEQKTTAEQAANLYIFIQHSDETKELIQGELVPYDASGKQGLRFTIKHFSTFTVLEGQPAKQAAMSKAYMKGFKDGTFRPDRQLTRAEMAMILYNLSGTNGQEQSASYSDVSAKHWAVAAIGFATSDGLMKGAADGKFYPERPITRAEMAVITLRLRAATTTETAAFAFSDTVGHWAEASISKAQAAGYMNGYKDGAFRPEQPLTRAEAVAILNRVLERNPLTAGEGKWSDVPTGYWAFEAIQAATVDHQAR